MQTKSHFLIISLVLLAVITGCFLFSSQVIQALGISPPRVINYELLRGSHFEKIVYINQGSPKEPLHATVEIDIPSNFRDWITILPGMEFTVPMENLFPVTVVIDVPPDAEFGEYQGEIRILTSPETKGGTIAVGIGIGINVDLKVTEKEIIDYVVALWEIKPMESGWPFKISFTIENRGNVKVRPLKVLLDVYNETKTELLGSAEATNLAYVDSFTRKGIIAEFPIDLAVGTYWAKIKFYKNENEVLEYQNYFKVSEKGTLPKEGKGWVFWLLVGMGTGVLVGIVVWLWRKFGKKISALFSLVARPFITIKKKFKKILRVLKEKE